MAVTCALTSSRARIRPRQSRSSWISIVLARGRSRLRNFGQIRADRQSALCTTTISRHAERPKETIKTWHIPPKDCQSCSQLAASRCSDRHARPTGDHRTKLQHPTPHRSPTIPKSSWLPRSYWTRVLISEATTLLAGDMVKTREIDAVVVVGKTEPQRIFELLGR